MLPLSLSSDIFEDVETKDIIKSVYKKGNKEISKKKHITIKTRAIHRNEKMADMHFTRMYCGQKSFQKNDVY